MEGAAITQPTILEEYVASFREDHPGGGVYINRRKRRFAINLRGTTSFLFLLPPVIRNGGTTGFRSKSIGRR